MDLILKTQKSLFKDSRPLLNSILAQSSYYPPDISVVKLAKQDKRLDNLKLKDFKLSEQILAQQRLLKRGKSIRVDIVTGPLKIPEKTKKSKSRKR